MEVFICGNNSFNQLSLNYKSVCVGKSTTPTKDNSHSPNSLQQSVLQPSCQLTLPEDEKKSDIDIHFTWSRCIVSINTDNEKCSTYITGSGAKQKSSKVIIEHSLCASSVEGSGIILLRDGVDPNKLSVLREWMSESLPLTIRSDENQKSGLNLQTVAGGHRDVYAVYGGVSFGKFQLPNNLNISRSRSEVDSETERHPLVEEKELILTIQHIDCVTPIKEISCGKEHVLLLTESGNVYSYGLSSRGQLGHGEIENETSPRLVDALDGLAVKKVVAGGWHSVAVSEIGDLYVWGWNESGQLGLRSIKKGENMTSKGNDDADSAGIVATPVCLDIPNGENVKDVACGSRHTVVLTETGDIFTCGWNAYGQLGLGDAINRDSLTRVAGVTTGCRVFAGHWNTAYVCMQRRT